METLKLVTSTEVVAPHLLRPDVPRDLETICLKCLEKEPHEAIRDRGGPGGGLAAVSSRTGRSRPGPWEPVGRVQRWSRRNPWIAGLSATIVATLVVGIVVSACLTIRARRAERNAVRRRKPRRTNAFVPSPRRKSPGRSMNSSTRIFWPRPARKTRPLWTSRPIPTSRSGHSWIAPPGESRGSSPISRSSRRPSAGRSARPTRNSASSRRRRSISSVPSNCIEGSSEMRIARHSKR